MSNFKWISVPSTPYHSEDKNWPPVGRRVLVAADYNGDGKLRVHFAYLSTRDGVQWFEGDSYGIMGVEKWAEIPNPNIEEESK